WPDCLLRLDEPLFVMNGNDLVADADRRRRFKGLAGNWGPALARPQTCCRLALTDPAPSSALRNPNARTTRGLGWSHGPVWVKRFQVAACDREVAAPRAIWL